MSEGAIAKDLATETKMVSEFCRRNPSMKLLLVKFYLLGEAWAQLKKIELKDIDVVDMRLTNDNRIFWFRFKKAEGGEENKPLGIYDPSGQVVA